ncbi:MAG: gliding motility-associated C-terminal domain-containing protein [Bacteroidetes bacterium]|nr:gliding motility-associated C-terminal domain-containing protein [Bacteroidota bacterium]
MTASGGTTGYTYLWTPSGGTAATASGLAAGSYNVTVTDAHGCTITNAVTISQPASNVSAMISSQTNVLCFGNNTGSATISTSGGTPGYTYSWLPSGGTAATATGLTAGTYTCSVHDNNNCSFAVIINISQPTAALLVSIPTHTNVLCFGSNTGIANATASGGTLPYNYSWTPSGGTAATATGLSAGTYTVTVRDANNCTSTASVSITQPATAITASLTGQTNVLCFGASTGIATVTASGGTPPYNYFWTPIGGTAATASSLPAGNYTCTIHDANNCTSTVNTTITQPLTVLAASITSSTNVLCRGNTTGSATVTATGGSGSYLYSWSPSGGTGFTTTSISAGTYTVTVNDANGCTTPSTATVTITQPAAILSATSTSPTFNGNNISCKGGNNGSINLTPAGGTSPYTFVWTGPGAFTATTEDISSLYYGTYSVTVTDSHGCTTTLNKTITEPTLLALSSTVTNATCPSFLNGSINLTVSGGTAPYTFAWTGPSAFTASTEDISGLASGSYSITVTDLNGCVKTTTITVTQPSSIVISNTTSSFTGGFQVSCFNGNNGSINITVVGGTPFPGPVYTYSWTGPGAFTATTQNISGLLAGTYQVIVTDMAGCTANKIITLSQPAAVSSILTPVIVNGGYNITCNGSSNGSVNLVPAGGTSPYSYSWTGPSAFTSTLQNISGLIAGTYTVVVTDINSCTGTNTIMLTEPLLLNASATAPTVAGGYNITCNGASNGSINLSVSGGTTGYNYSWTGPGAFTSASQNPSSLAAGTYSVTVTDANGCTATTNITLTQPPILSNTLNSPTVAGGFNINCNGASNGSINNSVTGGVASFTYTWTGPGSYSNTNQNISALGVGTYSVIVTDANGCTSSSNITLTQPTILSSSATSPTFTGGTNLSCNGDSTGSINLEVNGGTFSYTYSWNGPGAYSSTSQNPNGLLAGNYNVTVTDANGCTSTSSVLLTQPALLTSSIMSPTYNGGYNLTCNGSTDGSINLTTTGGTAVYSYAWTGPSGFTSTNEDISSLAAGTYNVIVTDINGCSTNSNIVLTQPAVFSGTLTSSTYNGGYNISCFGNTNGTVTLTLGGGTTPYTYNWNNGALTQNLSSVGAGTYNVIVNDANNCSFTQSIILTEPDILIAQAASPTVVGGFNINCNGNNNGSIELGVGGGTGPYIFAWTGPSSFSASTEDIASLTAGSYSVLVTDNNGCIASTSLLLTEPDPMNIALSSNILNGGYNISCNGNNNGNINTIVTGGTPLYMYSWTGPSSFLANTAAISSLIAGNYSLTVLDTNGCIASSSITLTEPAILNSIATNSIYTGGFNISCNGSNDGSITLTTSGGTSPFDFNWTGPAGFTASSANISGLTVGTYSLIITDANGCSFSLTQSLTQPLSMTDSLILSSFIGGNNISCFGGTNGSINLSIAGGALPYNQTWIGPSGYTSTASILTGLNAGNYSVVISDANGCIINDNATLTQPTILSNTLSAQVYIGGFNIKCRGDSSGVIYNTVIGGTPNYSYSWTGPGTFTSNSMELYSVPAGTYNLTITDTNSCTANSSFALSEAPTNMTGTLAPSMFTGDFNISCNGGSNGSIDLTYTGGTPGYTIWWRGPDSYTDSIEDISGLFAGNYDLVVTDTNGCQLVMVITLTEPTQAIKDSLFVSEYAGSVNVSCAGSSNGSIDLSPSGGTMGYNYSWSGPAGYSSTLQDLVGISAGSYTLTIADTNGCSLSDTILLIEPNALSSSALLSSYQGNNISCFGNNDGFINFSINGGTAGFTYLWTGPGSYSSNSEDISGLIIGTYSLTVTDTNGCVLDTSYSLTEPIVLSSGITTTPSTCAAMNGTANLSIAGGTLPYSTLWSNGTSLEDLYGITGGTYTVVIIDANGCTLNDTATIGQISLMAINSTVNNVLCFGNTDGSIQLEVTNGTQPFTYSWSNGETTSNLTNISAGTYIVTVGDAFGCSVIDTFTVTQSTQLILAFNSNLYYGGFNISSYQGTDGNIDLSVSGGFSPYSFIWSNNSNTEDQLNLPAGVYSVVVTDSAGCSSIGNITLTEPSFLELPTGFSPNGDGKNDLFVIHGIEVFSNNELEIFNRWGNSVNHFTGYNNTWDGRSNSGELLPAGTYFVILQINGSEKVFKGYVDLRR